jgi:hypothetical protein
VRDHLSLRTPLEDGNTEREEQIFEDFDVSGDRLAFDLGLSGDIRDIEDIRVGKADCLEEAGKRPDIARPTIKTYFFVQIERGVGAEDTSTMIELRR